MSEEFEPIETQEAFDAAVQERVTQATKQFENWISPEKAAEQNQALQSEINTLKTANLRMKIAQETGVPPELAERLTGSTEEEIRKDAEKLSKFSVSSQPVPAFHPEKPPSGDAKTAAYREMLKKLNQ